MDTPHPSPRHFGSRLPLTLKTVLLMVGVGAVLWALFDRIQEWSLRRLFEGQTEERLASTNANYRLLFDHHVKDHQTLLKLLVSQSRFREYIGTAGWLAGEPRVYRRSPPWFPRPSVLRNIAPPRIALLMDAQGRVRETFLGAEPSLPGDLLDPSHLLREASHEQVLMTELDGRPFLITSERVTDDEGRPLADVILASPIDNEFLRASQQLWLEEDGIVVLFEGHPGRVIASSDPRRVAPGAGVDTLSESYRIAGDVHFDYGASDLQLRFATLMPIKELRRTIDALLDGERVRHAITAIAFTLAAMLMVGLVSRRLDRVTARIDAFGREMSGRGQDIGSAPRDPLDRLEQRFERLTTEVGEARASLQRQAEVLRREKEEQNALLAKLKETQSQLLHSEKMAAIGQLAAGVAHEINNPIAYVSTNIGTLRRYVADLLRYVDACTALGADDEAARARLSELAARYEIAFLRDDAGDLLNETAEGLARVKRIVQDLKDFSRADREDTWEWADLNRGLETTLNIIHNELKYKCEVVKALGELPPVHCLPSQLNQVFMNLLVNAAQAIDEHGTITIRTTRAGSEVRIAIADTGRGIAPADLARVFEPFFTTKPVGTGTGLGLAIAYGIVDKHDGRIEVESEVGRGTVFTVVLPIDRARQPG